MKPRLKKIYERIVPEFARVPISRWKRSLQKNRLIIFERLDHLELNHRMLGLAHLQQRYGAVMNRSDARSEINKHELKIFSQNGEDGVLLNIFSEIGVTNCRFVEFGIGDGKECNTANLSINFGWKGLLMEGDQRLVLLARSYYSTKLGHRASDVKIMQSFVTRETINPVLVQNGLEGEIDLLSIDIDGNDYWVWEAINCINPRVVVIEYNATFGANASISVPYDPAFDVIKKHHTQFYHGASLAAMTKLANRKGYMLVGCESDGVNAFYIRRNVLRGNLKETPVADAFFPHGRRRKWISDEKQFDVIKHLGFVEV